jgi:alcohol dehydrogenase class IV
MSFDFSTASRIIFGIGTLKDAGKIASQFGSNAFLVSSCGGVDPSHLMDILKTAGIHYSSIEVCGEPTVSFLLEAVQAAKKNQSDLVISFGGGSVIDTGKAVAAMLTNPGDLLDYLEVVGRGRPLLQPSMPMIAIPTTAGTGSEVTRNAVLAVPEQQVKVSLRSPLMLPRLALVDPELTFSLPPAITASTGMDALTQVIEPYVSVRANEMVDLYCREGIMRAARSLKLVYHHGDNVQGRVDMAWASLLGGLCLANAGLGAAHGFAAPIGGMFTAPHGAVCASLIPLVVEANYRALRERQPENPVISRYVEIARILCSNDDATVEDGIEWLKQLCSDLQIPPLSDYGVRKADIEILVQKSTAASSMKANPIQLTATEMADILEKAL